jgi:hypothetical protein
VANRTRLNYGCPAADGAEFLENPRRASSQGPPLAMSADAGGLVRWFLSGHLYFQGRPTPGLLLPSEPKARGGDDVLWTFFAILLVLWMMGWGMHIAGSLIHLLLLVALVILLGNVLLGRRAA